MSRDIGADPLRAEKLSKARAFFGDLEANRRQVRGVVSEMLGTRRAARHDTSDAKAQPLSQRGNTVGPKGRGHLPPLDTSAVRAELFEEMSVAMRLAMQTGVPVIAFAVLGSLPNGAANGDQRIQGATSSK